MKRLRSLTGLSAQMAAEKGGLSLRLYQKIEAGADNATMASLVKVCIGLDADMDELFIEPPKKG